MTRLLATSAYTCRRNETRTSPLICIPEFGFATGWIVTYLYNGVRSRGEVLLLHNSGGAGAQARAGCEVVSSGGSDVRSSAIWIGARQGGRPTAWLGPSSRECDSGAAQRRLARYRPTNAELSGVGVWRAFALHRCLVQDGVVAAAVRLKCGVPARTRVRTGTRLSLAGRPGWPVATAGERREESSRNSDCVKPQPHETVLSVEGLCPGAGSCLLKYTWCLGRT